ncbi:MAG: thioredoxin-dependent thiol peroxidase, partial [Acidobacteria bacterium]|nr:thioredoxin-dependent thiol peroxidase [Acidobacteriota bacterium]MCW5967305.1 thioredoxin-dependent thiol peroxidase [Blastocatellales bacterium]
MSESQIKTTLKAGDKAPAFSLKNSDGNTVRLSDFKGRKLVLYFYPKDMTPGCTKEACGFRDDYAELKKRGVEVVGVSPDTAALHQKFTSAYSLPFELLSDPTREVMMKYGAWGEKTMYGKKVTGVLRSTFIIDESGRIAHIFRKVKTDTHSRDVIGVLDKL